MSTEANDVLGTGDAAACKANFQQNVKDFGDQFFLFSAILDIIPYTAMFRGIYNIFLHITIGNMEAQFLCWKKQAPEEAA